MVKNAAGLYHNKVNSRKINKFYKILKNGTNAVFLLELKPNESSLFHCCHI